MEEVLTRLIDLKLTEKLIISQCEDMGEQMSQPHTEKKTEKHNNKTIQNKIMKIMVLQILREIAKNLQDADLFCNG